MCVDLRAMGDDVILLRTGDVLAVWFSSAAGGSEGSVNQCTHTTTVLYRTGAAVQDDCNRWRLHGVLALLLTQRH